VGVLSLGRGGRLLGFDGFCSVIGITVMDRKRYEEPEDEPCLLSPVDDPAMLDTPEDEPVGPEWWEGRWPAGGIASLEDLERWVNAELEEMISLNWTHPKTIGGEFARKIGRQALRNATRYLDRHGPGNHPPHPTPDKLEHIEQIEAALGAILRHIRQGRSQGSEASTTPNTAHGPLAPNPKPATKRPSGDPEKRSWLQHDLDDAIRKYKAKHASTYHDLVKGVRAGRKVAIDAARDIFGRNAIARALGVKAQAMVSKSPPWREIAEELKLTSGEGRSLGGARRMGLDIAIESKAEEEGVTPLDELVKKETLALVKKSMPPEVAANLIERLEAGTIDDEEVREMVILYEDQQSDQKRHKIPRRP